MEVCADVQVCGAVLSRPAGCARDCSGPYSYYLLTSAVVVVKTFPSPLACSSWRLVCCAPRHWGFTFLQEALVLRALFVFFVRCDMM